MWEDVAPPSQHQNLSKSLPGSLDQMVKIGLHYKARELLWQLEPCEREGD